MSTSIKCSYAGLKSDDFYFPGELNPLSRVPWKLIHDA